MGTDRADTEEKLSPSPELAAIVGGAKISRTRAVDAARRRCMSLEGAPAADTPGKLPCDAALRALTGKPSVSLFELCGAVIHHLS